MPTRLNSPPKLFIPFASSSSTLFTGPLTATDGFIKYNIINFGFEHVAFFVIYFMIFRTLTFFLTLFDVGVNSY